MDDADLVGSATAWAVTVTAWEKSKLAGAVYRPVDEIEPTDGLIDQFTAVLLEPDTVAVNCWLPDGPKVTEDGLTTSVTACMRVKTALALLLGSATLVAVIVTV
jgi:hypothetical protein